MANLYFRESLFSRFFQLRELQIEQTGILILFLRDISTGTIRLRPIIKLLGFSFMIRIIQRSFLKKWLLLLFLCSCGLANENNRETRWMEGDLQSLYYRKSLSYLSGSLDQKKTVTGIPVDSLKFFTEALEKLKKAQPETSKEQWKILIDSIRKSCNLNLKGRKKVTPDKDYITQEYLEHQTGLAFAALREAGWNSSVSFEDFCEYILPYKLGTEVADNWRDTLYRFHRKLVAAHPELDNLDSLYLYHKRNTYNALDKEVRLTEFYPAEDNFSWLNFSQEGDCSSRCRYMIYYLRAAGVPATYDHIPAWGNRPYSRHAYVGLANRKQQVKTLLENTNDPRNQVNDLNATVTDTFLYVFPENEMPPGLSVQYEKTIPKIYRETWTAQEKMIRLHKKVSGEEIYAKLVKPNMTDVTGQYLRTAEVAVRGNMFSRHKIAYLAVFDRSGWMPVAYSEFNWFGKAVFRQMGKNIVYMPMNMENGRPVAVGNPFILDNNGEKKLLQPDYEKRADLHLIRKYPLFAYSAIHVAAFKDAVFRGANEPDFSDAKDIYTISQYPFYPLEASVTAPEHFRYIRLDTKDGAKARVEKLEFYTRDKNGKLLHLKGKISRADRMLQMELDSASCISKIEVWPRNDLNYIIPGNQYELFFWDKDWISAGVRIASDFYLDYAGIPSGTLYWLRCLNEGKEERIFTYENGKQFWW